MCITFKSTTFRRYSYLCITNAGMQHMVRITFTLRLVALHKWRHHNISLSFCCSKKVQVPFCFDYEDSILMHTVILSDRVFTILMEVNSTFLYMVYLELLTQQCILTAS